MKLILACLLSMLGVSAALAGAPVHVIGQWKPMRMVGVAGFSGFTFTRGGKLLITSTGLGVADQLIGPYEVHGDKVFARSSSGETYAFELMNDGKLCTYPGPGMVPVDGQAKSTEGERRCYERASPHG